MPGLFSDLRYRTEPWCRNADAGLRLLTTGRNADAVLTFLRHLHMIFQYHIARITPSAGVYGRAGVSVSTTCSLDVYWVPFSPCSMNIYIYIIILCYHLCHVIILCYHLFDVIIFAIIWFYHLVLSFISCLSQLTKICGTFTQILSRSSQKYGLRFWGSGSGIWDPGSGKTWGLW